MPTVFTKKAPTIMGWLIRDLGVTVNQAAGILGNIGHECAGFILLQEVHPKSGAGGYGWCQWTGDRRDAFFAYCKAHGLSVDSDAGNYGYLLHELKGSEAAAITAIKHQSTVNGAVAAFEQKFERAGVLNYADRNTYAKLALDAYAAAHTR